MVRRAVGGTHGRRGPGGRHVAPVVGTVSLTRLRASATALKDAWIEHHLMVYASAVAFRVLIALVPLVLLALGVLGALGLEDMWTDSIAPKVQDRVTAPVFTAIDFSVEGIFASGSAGLIAFASLLLLWELSRAVRVIMVAFNELHEVGEHRSGAQLLWVTLGLAVAIGLALVACMLVVTVLPRLVHEGLAHAGLTVVAWAVAIVLLGFATGLLIRYAPAEQPQMRWATAGSALVVGTWIVASLAFGWYAGSIANYETAVGSLTVFLVLTAYVLVSSAILLFGVLVDERARWEAGEK